MGSIEPIVQRFSSGHTECLPESIDRGLIQWGITTLSFPIERAHDRGRDARNVRCLGDAAMICIL
jgi:hypothetical protein